MPFPINEESSDKFPANDGAVTPKRRVIGKDARKDYRKDARKDYGKGYGKGYGKDYGKNLMYHKE